MPRIFAYILHQGGIADDSAAELIAAAQKIDATISPTAIVAGCGADLDAICETLRTSFAEIWKISNEALAYPNAELIRRALLKVVPPGGIVLAAHEHFGIDLAPGLSIKMNAAFVSDVLAIEAPEGHATEHGSSGIRRTGERACPVRYLIGRSNHCPSRCIPTAGDNSRHRRRSRQIFRDRSTHRRKGLRGDNHCRGRRR